MESQIGQDVVAASLLWKWKCSGCTVTCKGGSKDHGVGAEIWTAGCNGYLLLMSIVIVFVGSECAYG